MKTALIKIFSCDYCPAYYKREHFAKQHEAKCQKNPVNDRACFDCVYAEKRKVEAYSNIGDHTFKMEVVFCKKKEVGIYPPSIEHKGNAVELTDYTNDPMPIECDDQFTIEESMLEQGQGVWLFTEHTKQ